MAVTIKGFASDWSVPEPAKTGLDALNAASLKNPATTTGDTIIALLGNLLSDPAPATPGLVTLGDSITIGASISGTAHADAWPTYATALSEQKLRLIRNSGVAGNTTTQMLARFDADVAARSPKIVSLLAGSNDLMQAVPHATIRANIRDLIARIRGIGAEPIVCTVPPRIGGETLVREHNKWLRGYAAVEGLRLVDMFSALANGEGWKAGFDSGDGIHPSPAGYKAMGAKFHDTITPKLGAPFAPPLATAADDPDNYLTNALFTVDANTDGLADGWTVQGPTANSVRTLEPATVGNWQVFDVVTEGANAGISQSRSATAAGWVAGDRARFLARVSLPQGGNASFSIVFGGGGTGTLQMARNLTQSIDNGVLMLEFTIPAGATTATIYFIASKIGKYKISQATWKKIV